MGKVEVKAAQQEDEIAGVGRTTDGFEEHGMECIQEAGRFHAGAAVVAGQAEVVVRDVVGSAGGGTGATVVIIKPACEQGDQGRRVGMRDGPGMKALI